MTDDKDTETLANLAANPPSFSVAPVSSEAERIILHGTPAELRALYAPEIPQCNCTKKADSEYGLWGEKHGRPFFKKPSDTQYMYVFAKSHAEFFRDEYSHAWGLLKQGQHYETWKVSAHDERFVGWLSNQYFVHTKQVGAISSIKNAIALLLGQHLPLRNMHKRYWWEAPALCIALHNASWNVLRITQDGCTIEDNKGQYRRYGHELPYDFKACGPEGWKVAFDLFFNKVFPRVSDESQYMLTILLTAFMVPEVPAPAIVFFGAAGNGKSTATKLCTDLIDPQSTSRMALKEDLKETSRELAQRWVTGYDNLRYFEPETSDLFCQHITGGTNTARALYTDEDSVSKKMFGRLILNGIDMVARAHDLLRRTIAIECVGLPDAQLIDDSIIYEQAALLMPFLRSTMFIKVVMAQQLLPQVEASSGTMPGFARWGEAISCAYGFPYGTFGKVYADFLDEQILDTAENSSIIGSLALTIEKHRTEMPWRVTLKDLLSELRENADFAEINQKGWPQTPRALRGALGAHKRMVLKTLNIEIKYPQKANGIRYVLFTNNSYMNHIGADRGQISRADEGQISSAHKGHITDKKESFIEKNGGFTEFSEKIQEFLTEPLKNFLDDKRNIDVERLVQNLALHPTIMGEKGAEAFVQKLLREGTLMQVRPGVLRVVE